MNHTTGAERRNARMHKIFEDARRRKVDAAYPQLVSALRECVRLLEMAGYHGGGAAPGAVAARLLHELGEADNAR